MEFSIDVGNVQRDKCKHLLHEQFLSGITWTTDGIMNLAGMQGVMRTTVQLCRFGTPRMTSEGSKCVNTYVGVLAISHCVAEGLHRCCVRDHRRIVLNCKRSFAAYTHAHTHTHIYIYIYMLLFLFLFSFICLSIEVVPCNPHRI